MSAGPLQFGAQDVRNADVALLGLWLFVARAHANPAWDEEMVAVRSNKEMVKNSSLDTNRPIQVTDWAMETRYHSPLHE